MSLRRVTLGLYKPVLYHPDVNLSCDRQTPGRAGAAFSTALPFSAGKIASSEMTRLLAFSEILVSIGLVLYAQIRSKFLAKLSQVDSTRFKSSPAFFIEKSTACYVTFSRIEMKD